MLTLTYGGPHNKRTLEAFAAAQSDLGFGYGSARSHLGMILPAKDWKTILPPLMTKVSDPGW